MSEAARQRYFRLLERVKSVNIALADRELASALQATPKDPNILHLAAQVAEGMGDQDRAILLYRRAITVQPYWFEGTMNLARVLAGKKNYDEAINLLQKLAPHHPNRPEITKALAHFIQATGNLPEAIHALQNVIEESPDDFLARGALAFCQKQICDWSEPLPLEDVRFAPRYTAVFYDDPALQKSAAEAFCQRQFGDIDPLPAVKPYHHDKIKVGYLSSDFHAHATSWLMAELFTLHDRSRFEVYVYSYGIEDHSAIRQRLRDEADHFVELNTYTPALCAQKIREDEIDILIDLKGHTHGGRLDILAYRPAPIQLHWLGFPATTGAPFIDGFIADPVTVPAGSESAFTEKVYRLPHTYQINDREKEIGPAQDKAAYGLPEDSLVLASFNQTYKITPETFSIWCDLLHELPESVLWLYESNVFAPSYLMQEAEKRGIDPSRLFFAKPAPLAEHLARYHVVDLALDTFPVGGHTTTSDALWVGAPVVTMIGQSFVSRVAGSLLTAANLGYLVTSTPDEYKALILKMAKDKEKRSEIRNMLQMKKKILPLFDTPLFVNAFEKLLLEMV